MGPWSGLTEPYTEGEVEAPKVIMAWLRSGRLNTRLRLPLEEVEVEERVISMLVLGRKLTLSPTLRDLARTLSTTTALQFWTPFC